MIRTIVGIDPGKHGGIAFWEYDPMLAEGIVRTVPMPVLVSQTKARKRPKPRPDGKPRKHKSTRDVYELDEGVFRDLFAGFDATNCTVYIEYQQPMKRFDKSRIDPFTHRKGCWVPAPAASTASLMGFYYLPRGILAGLGLPYRIVRPKVWQADMLTDRGKTNTKTASILVSKSLFPYLTLLRSPRSKVPSDGLADAALICAYGVRRELGESLCPRPIAWKLGA
jgi:hypothetical protein